MSESDLMDSPVPATDGVVLRFDGVCVWIARDALLAVEPLAGLQGGAHPPALGWVGGAGQRAALYALDHALEPLASVAAQRTTSAIVESNGRRVALACESVDMLSASAVLHQALPDCAATPGSPVLGLALHGDEVLTVVAAASLVEGIAPPVGGSTQQLSTRSADSMSSATRTRL